MITFLIISWITGIVLSIGMILWARIKSDDFLYLYGITYFRIFLITGAITTFPIILWIFGSYIKEIIVDSRRVITPKFKIEYLDNQVYNCQEMNVYQWMKKHRFSRNPEWVLYWQHIIGNEYKSPLIKSKDDVIKEMESDIERTIKDYNVTEIIRGTQQLINHE